LENHRVLWKSKGVQKREFNDISRWLGVLVYSLKRSCYNWCLLIIAWTKVKGNNDMIGYAASVSVSTSCSRCNNLAWSPCFMIHLLHGLYIIFSWLEHIYNVDTTLYPYTLPIDYSSYPFSSICLSCNLSQT